MAVDEVVIRAVLRDELSRGLAQIRGEVMRLDKTMISAQRGTTGLATSFTNLDRGMRSATSGLGKMSMSLAQFTGRSLQTATIGMAGLSVAAVGFGLKSAASFESSRIAFGTLLGGVEQGNALFEQLQKFNLQTPFGLDDISSATQTLLQFGFGADNVMQTLKGISDVAALTANPGENLSRIAVAIGQISGAGVLRAQDLNQLVQAGFPAYKLLEELTGKTAQEIRKQMETGLELPAEKFISAVQRQQGVLARYAGGAAAQAKTLRGVWSNFVDMLKVRLADAMGPLATSLQTMLPQFSNSLGRFIDSAAPALSRIAVQLLDMLTKSLPAIEPLLTGVFTALTQVLASPAMAELGPAMANLVTQFVPQIPALVDAFIGLALLLPPLVDVLSSLIPLVTPVAQGATALTDAAAKAGGSKDFLPVPVQIARGIGGWIGPKLFGDTPAPAMRTTVPSSMTSVSSTSSVTLGPGSVTVNNPGQNVDVARALEEGIARERAARERRG